ncbi:MAG: hypothetical protein WAM24_19390 [Ignavibacteriaceae bacterium]
MYKFHIPVMGLAFTIDTPLKVAHFGINSVISIVDDDLIEKMRKIHSKKNNISFIPISTKEPDYRAKRITLYLNLIHELVNKNFTSFKEKILNKDSEVEKYFSMFPDYSELKLHLESYKKGLICKDEFKALLDKTMHAGSIDVNIMTKVDKANFDKSGKLPIEFNDAHASLRGFAQSTLNSSVVLSAGMNPKLYSYLEHFKDFSPDENGELKKKIILKVSDYRSALIQGKFLAKKGLWVSEYRVESGLNCGGHAFATDGYLIGPILEEFKTYRKFLIDTIHEIYTGALNKKNILFNGKPRELKITAQGGVGTSEENNFLLDYYQLDSVGWGSPFLLVPEATNVDERTLGLLCGAKEDDLYLSNTSPLGVPFNSLRGNTKDDEKEGNALHGKPGSSCPKKLLISDTEFSKKPICTASVEYQSQKIKQLKISSVSIAEKEKAYNKVIDKTCLCVGLAFPALEINNAVSKVDGVGTAVCPGPNMAYFSSIVSLSDIVNHIYGRINIITRNDRPNMFMKELKLYLNYLEEKISSIDLPASANQIKHFNAFVTNVSEGIEYYKQLFSGVMGKIFDIKKRADYEIGTLEEKLRYLMTIMAEKNLLSEVSNCAAKVSFM